MKKCVIVAIVGLLAIAALVVRVGVLAAQPAKPGELPVKEVAFGGVIPLTGPAAPWGLAFMNGSQMKIQEIAALGGIKTKEAIYNVKWLGEDSGVSAESGRLAAESLVYQQKAKFIFGPVFAAMMPAIVPVVTSGKVINLAFTMSPARIGADRPYCFGVLSDYQYMIPLHLKAIKNKYPEIKTFGHLKANDESGHANTPYIANACKANAIELFSEAYERNQQDYYPLLTRLLARKPDCIGAVWTDGEAGMIIKQAREMGYKGLFYDINPHDVATIIKLAGAERAEGFMFQALPYEGPWSPPGLAELRQKYVAKFNSTAGIDFGLQLYDHLGMLATAIEKAGTADTDQVKAALETLRYKGLRGDMRFGGSKLYGISHQIAQPEFLCQIQNGKLVGIASVTPEDILKIIGE